jgi:pyruvate/2-oxoglutarate dehydrogenase complex dihydrolipoamide acyltransferase (E2) component
MHKELVRMPDGANEFRDIVEMTLTLDERIADGFYFAKSLRIAKHLFEHPELLAQNISTPVDVEL